MDETLGLSWPLAMKVSEVERIENIKQGPNGSRGMFSVESVRILVQTKMPTWPLTITNLVSTNLCYISASKKAHNRQTTRS